MVFKAVKKLKVNSWVWVILAVFVGVGIFSWLAQPTIIHKSGFLVFDIASWFQSDSVVFESFWYDDKTFVNQYPLGNLLLVSSDLGFECQDRKGEFVAPQPRSDCWVASLSNKRVSDGGVIDFNLFNVSLEVEGRYVSDFGFVSFKDKKSRWKIKVEKDVLVLNKVVSSFLVRQNSVEKYSLIFDSKISGVSGGFVVKEQRGLFREEKVRVEKFVLNRGVNVFVFSVPTQFLGTMNIVVSPFIELYDFEQGLTSEDTGYCFYDKKQQKHCVNKKMISVSEPININFNVISQDIDINKNIKTSCTITSQCLSGFQCIDKICEYQRITTKKQFFNIENNYFFNIIQQFFIKIKEVLN